MPTVAVKGEVSAEQAMEALRNNMGVRYKFVAGRGGGSFSVKSSPLFYATVRTQRQGDSTVFSVHGGGLIITRLVNELGIARQVAQALSKWEPPAS
ncbi:MAG TPA: hypothetical protein VND83_01310 [Acidimicrobiales bacterium]|nr:hypothetical protein [Acidimicrobiales bacterium]